MQKTGKNSLKKSQSVSEAKLKTLKKRAEKVGYPAALCSVFRYPNLPYINLKENALKYYLSLPACSFCPYLLERAWVKAFEDYLNHLGKPIEFTFPHLDNLTSEKSPS